MCLPPESNHLATDATGYRGGVAPHSREAGVIDAFSYTHAVYVDTGTRRTHGYSLLPLRWMFVCSPLGHTRLLGLSRHEIELRRGRHGRWEQVRSSDEEEYASGHLV